MFQVGNEKTRTNFNFKLILIWHKYTEYRNNRAIFSQGVLKINYSQSKIQIKLLRYYYDVDLYNLVLKDTREMI